MAKLYDLELLVTDERMKDMSLETFYNLENSPKATVDFVAWFVTKDGKYLANFLEQEDGSEVLDNKEAVKHVVTGRHIKDVEGIMEDLRSAIENKAVPKA